MADVGSVPVRVVAVHQQCIECGYDLHGLALSARCPECGTEVAASVSGHQALLTAGLPLVANRMSRLARLGTIAIGAHAVSAACLWLSLATQGTWTCIAAIASVFAGWTIIVAGWLPVLRRLPANPGIRRARQGLVVAMACLVLPAMITLASPKGESELVDVIVIGTFWGGFEVARVFASSSLLYTIAYDLADGRTARRARQLTHLSLLGLLVCPLGIGPAALVWLERRLTRAVARTLREREGVEPFPMAEPGVLTPATPAATLSP